MANKGIHVANLCYNKLMIKKNAGGVLLATLLLSLAVFSFSAFAAEDRLVGGEVNVVAGVEPVLRINLPKDITIRIEPGNRDAYTVPVSLNIYSNNPGGYFSFISTNKNRVDAGDTDANALHHKEDNRWKIDALTSNTTVEEFPFGHWGYSIDGGKTFDAVPAASDTPASANTDAGLYFGVKVPEDQASGMYSATIIATAVTRHVLTQDELFDGIEYMQDMTQEICETENAGMSKQLIDRRDGKTYWVTKMRDNNCWMTQNLDFEIASSGTTLTPSDSNVFATRTISKEATGESNNIFYIDAGDYYIPNGDGYDENDNPASTNDLDPDSTEWHYHVGSIYSWAAATAGSGTENTRIGEADESICPAGWRLPISEGIIVQNRNYSFYKLFMAQPETTLDMDYNGSFRITTSIGASPFYFIDARKIQVPEDYEFTTMPFFPIETTQNGLTRLERDAKQLFAFWTSTAYPALNPAANSNSYTWSWDYSNAQNLAMIYFGYSNYNSNNILGNGYHNSSDYRYKRNNGAFVRCVASKNDLYSISTMQEITSEIIKNTDVEATKRLVDTRDGKKYWVTKEYDGNIWMTENLDFEISTSGTTLNPTTSDVLGTKTLTADGAYGTNRNGVYHYDEGNYYYSDVYGTTGSSLSSFDNEQNTETHFRVGDYYSWNAATAGSGATTENGGDATESICPKGWRLPTSGESERDDVSYERMFTKLLEKSNADNFENYRFEAYYYQTTLPISFSPLFFHSNGYINDEGSKNNDGSATYWTSKLVTKNQDAKQFTLKSTSKIDNYPFTSDDTRASNIGLKVRCVARNIEFSSLSYDANGGYGAPSEQTSAGYSREHSFTISSETPHRNGFTFIGWATSPSKTDAEYQPGDTITFSQNNMTLYAVWTTTFQKFQCSNLSRIGDAIKLTDERDNQSYVVKKLADGKCWMIDNLRLDFSILIEDLSPENTNHPTEEFMNAVNASPRPSSSSDWCTTYGSADCYNQVLYNTYNNGDTTPDSYGYFTHNSYGTYYNWYTASAGNDPYDPAIASNPYKGKKLAGDICPSGWHLPTGGSDGEFVIMNNLYPWPDKPNTVITNTGYYYGTTASSGGMFYWVADDTSNMDMASWNSGGTSTNTWPRYEGAVIKCVADSKEQFHIVYDDNGGTNGPAAQVQATTNNKATFMIPYKTPTRTNFTFEGWATTPNAATATYQPGQEITVGTTITRLYAVWSAPFQNFNCGLLPNIGDTAVVKDSRDGKNYTVAKLADGHCWMTQNLQLEFSNLKEDITTENTNNPTATFMTTVNAHPSYTYDWCLETSAECIDQVLYYYPYSVWDSTTQTYNYSSYYNWYTATAGNGTYNNTDETVDGDICPAGWHLPVGGGFGEFGGLTNALGGRHGDDGQAYDMWDSTTPTGAELSQILRGSPNNFIFSGDKWGQYVYNTGSKGWYWSATSSNNGYARDLFINDSSTYPLNTNEKYMGAAIRCVADYQQEYAVYYNANGGTNAPAAQVITSGKGRATFYLSGNYPTRDGFDFVGWTSNPGSREVTNYAYQPVTLEANRPTLVLYAIWEATSITLQTFDCSTLSSIGSFVVVRDSRDNQPYTVAKLADGKCWLAENLRLNFANLQEDISASNTNNPSSTFMTTVNARPQPIQSWCSDQSQSCYNQVLFYNSGNGGSYGFHYNWYTATAGRGTYSTTGTATGDICPYGWHLPTGGNYGDVSVLSNALGGYQIDGAAQYMSDYTNPSGTRMVKVFRSYPNNFMDAGYHYQSSQYYGVSRYWTSTAQNNNVVRGLYMNSDYVDPGVYYTDYKYWGYSVRCLKN